MNSNYNPFPGQKINKKKMRKHRQRENKEDQREVGATRKHDKTYKQAESGNNILIITKK